MAVIAGGAAALLAGPGDTVRLPAQTVNGDAPVTVLGWRLLAYEGTVLRVEAYADQGEVFVGGANPVDLDRYLAGARYGQGHPGPLPQAADATAEPADLAAGSALMTRTAAFLTEGKDPGFTAQEDLLTSRQRLLVYGEQTAKLECRPIVVAERPQDAVHVVRTSEPARQPHAPLRADHPRDLGPDHLLAARVRPGVGQVGRLPPQHHAGCSSARRRLASRGRMRDRVGGCAPWIASPSTAG